MERLWQDLRFSVRMLVKNPGFTAVAMITLALGIGANTAIFSIVNGVLLRPLPYDDPDGLIMVWGDSVKTNLHEYPISIPDLTDLQNENHVADQMASYAYQDFNLTGSGDPEQIKGTYVSANFFSVLGVRPARGRTFLPEDGRPGAERVVVLSYGLWTRRFGGDQTLVGKTITLNGGSFTVIGVAPARFQSPNKGDELWATLSFDGGDRLRLPPTAGPDAVTNRSNRFLFVFARLKHGVTVKQARADLLIIASNLEREYPNTNGGSSVNVVPLRDKIVGRMQAALMVLLAAVGFVALIACANVANLLLARATARQKEIAIRAALGATRRRLVAQLLIESLLLGVLGGVLGLALAFGGIKLLLALNPSNIPRIEEIRIDVIVLAFTLALSVLTGLLFGLVPAIQGSKSDLNDVIREGSRGSTAGARQNRARSLLVIAEVALAELLLIGAGLMIKSFWSLEKVPVGFNPDGALTMQLSLPSSHYSEPKQFREFCEQVVERVETLPGVEAAGASTTLPLTDSKITFRFTVEGRVPATPEERLRADFKAVTPGYFRAMGIRLRDGRYFTNHDREDSPPVVIIGRTLASRYWPGQNPLGKRMTIPSAGGGAREVIGVVDDVKQSSLDEVTEPEMYVPFLQKPFSFFALAVRAKLDPASLTSAVRSQIAAIDKNQPIYDVIPLDQIVSNSLSQAKINTLLLFVFAALALLLASVGIYGVMNYTVTQRTHEIGIRMALGANAGNMIRLIVGKAGLLAFAGVVTGLVAAFALTRLLEGLLYGVQPRDLMIFAGVTVLLSGVSLISSYLPALRATRVEPMECLRYE